MKIKILLILFLLCFQYSFATYVKLIFINQSAIPSSSGNPVTINFNDSNLNVIISNYTVTMFQREYPIADSFPDYMTPAVELRLVYKIKIVEDSSHTYISLKTALQAANSPDLKKVIYFDEPISLTTPNDYYFTYNAPDAEKAYQHLNLVNALGAWNISTGLSCIKIGITDQDFKQHIDVDNKLNVTSRTVTPAPASIGLSHGMSVAGMAAAETNNNQGVAALGYNVRLNYYYNNLNGIVNAIYDGCKVVNCRWFDPNLFSPANLPPNDPMNDWKNVLDLANWNNVTIVAAAGNANRGSNTEYFYPASFDQVISVTSIGTQWPVGDLAHQGNWIDCHRMLPPNGTYTHQHNSRVDICAPGYSVEGPGEVNGYNILVGTSFAAPQVSAAAALLYSVNPFFTPTQITAFLKNNAVNIYSVCDNNVWGAGNLGAGRLDAGASLSEASQFAYTGNYCGACPSQTTYLTYYSGSYPNNTASVSGPYYNQNIESGSNNSPEEVSTSSSTSTSFVATNTITLKPEFHAIATANATFSAYITACRNSNPNKSAKQQISIVKDLLSSQNRFSIYPNPAHSNFTITFPISIEKNMTIKIINILGTIVKALSLPTTSHFKNIDIATLPTGLYYVILEYVSNTYKTKLIKF